MVNDFLHVDTRSQKSKTGQNSFGWTWSKMGVASHVTGLKNKQMELKSFFHAGTNSKKLKVGSILLGLVWSKITMAF